MFKDHVALPSARYPHASHLSHAGVTRLNRALGHQTPKAERDTRTTQQRQQSSHGLRVTVASPPRATPHRSVSTSETSHHVTDSHSENPTPTLYTSHPALTIATHTHTLPRKPTGTPHQSITHSLGSMGVAPRSWCISRSVRGGSSVFRRASSAGPSLRPTPCTMRARARDRTTRSSIAQKPRTQQDDVLCSTASLPLGCTHDGIITVVKRWKNSLWGWGGGADVGNGGVARRDHARGMGKGAGQTIEQFEGKNTHGPLRESPMPNDSINTINDHSDYQQQGEQRIKQSTPIARTEAATSEANAKAAEERLHDREVDTERGQEHTAASTPKSSRWCTCRSGAQR